MPSDSPGLEDYLEQTEGGETGLGELQEELEEHAEDGTITLKTGNFEQLAVLMIQDLKYDMMNVKEYLAVLGDEMDLDIQEEE